MQRKFIGQESNFICNTRLLVIPNHLQHKTTFLLRFFFSSFFIFFSLSFFSFFFFFFNNYFSPSLKSNPKSSNRISVCVCVCVCVCVWGGEVGPVCPISTTAMAKIVLTTKGAGIRAWIRRRVWGLSSRFCVPPPERGGGEVVTLLTSSKLGTLLWVLFAELSPEPEP